MNEPPSETPIVLDFRAFVQDERENYADTNLPAFALLQVGRYVRMTEIARIRYEEAASTFKTLFDEQSRLTADQGPGTHRVSEALAETMERIRLVGDLVHYEIESYFLFAHLLLDRIATTTEVFYGQVRGVSLRSHDKFRKNIAKYAAGKGIALPEKLIATAEQLWQSVTDHRDKEITHVNKPRATYGTSISSSGAASISKGSIYPREGEAEHEWKPSPDISEVASRIEVYLKLFMELIASNRQSSIYSAKTRGATG